MHGHEHRIAQPNRIGDERLGCEVKELNVNGIKVTTIYLEGTYNAGMMMSAGGPKPGFAALGAIAEGNQGPVFFKMTGPEKTIVLDG